MVHFFNPFSKISSKQRTVCLWLQKKNQLKDQPPYWLWNSAAFIRSHLFCLYPHNIWSPWCGYQQLATYLEKQPVLLKQAHVHFIWVGTHKKCTLHVCEAHDVHLQSSNLISIGYNKTYIGYEPGFFPLFFSFLKNQIIGNFLWKNHKIIQIHTRKSKVWNYISQRKKHWC